LSNNINIANVNNNKNVVQKSESAKGKDGKRGSLTGMSLLNFSEFVKIHVSISKVDEEFELNFNKKNSLQEETKLNNQGAQDKKVYINIQENEENSNEIPNENLNDNRKEKEIEVTTNQDVKEISNVKDYLANKKTNSSKGKGKNKSNMKQLQNSVLTEGYNNEDAKDKKLKDSAKSNIFILDF